MPVLQRMQQGVRALLSFTQPVDFDLAARYLSSEQLSLFRLMARSEQLHSLNVLRDVLRQQDQTPHDLAVAALLHDVGKARCRLSVAEKTISVILQRLVPDLHYRLGVDDQWPRWRAMFVVREHHPRWSAEMLAEVGTSERAIWLARHHGDPLIEWRDHPNYDLLYRLRLADDSN